MRQPGQSSERWHTCMYIDMFPPPYVDHETGIERNGVVESCSEPESNILFHVELPLQTVRDAWLAPASERRREHFRTAPAAHPNGGGCYIVAEIILCRTHQGLLAARILNTSRRQLAKL